MITQEKHAELLLESEQKIRQEMEQKFLREKEKSEENLLNSLTSLEAKMQQLQDSKQQADLLVAHLQDIIKELQRYRFGRKSEKLAPLDEQQLALFAAATNKATTPDEQDTQTIEAHERRAIKRPSRNALPEGLEEQVETYTVALPAGEDPADYQEIGYEENRFLCKKPAQLSIKVVRRQKLAKKDESKVLIATAPKRFIEKSLVDESVLADIITKKYVDHLPLYRIASIFKRAGVKFASSTVADWVKRVGEGITPVYEALKRQILAQDYLQADETTMRVQDPNKRKGTHKGYFWAYHAPLEGLTVFEYQPSREGEAAKTFLEDFTGYLQTDGYRGYNKVAGRTDITHLACWAHARRYFEKALDNDPQRANYVMALLQKLYKLEADLNIAEASEETYFKARKQHIEPLLKKLHEWLLIERDRVTPNSSIGTAINYTLNLWEPLQGYLKHGKLLPDNNPTERQIRPIAIGRKNYLFKGSHQAAQRSAMIYSLMAVCKDYQVNPYQYFHLLLTALANADTTTNYEDLLPHKIDLTALIKKL